MLKLMFNQFYLFLLKLKKIIYLESKEEERDEEKSGREAPSVDLILS